MPIKITHSVPQVAPGPRTSGLNSLAIAAIALATLHIVIGITLERSHAGPAQEVSALDEVNGDVKCSTETERQERTLPYD